MKRELLYFLLQNACLPQQAVGLAQDFVGTALRRVRIARHKRNVVGNFGGAGLT